MCLTFGEAILVRRQASRGGFELRAQPYRIECGLQYPEQA